MEPTLGRIVLYHADGDADPCAAIVAHVHGDGRTINVGFFHHTGTYSLAQNVPYGFKAVFGDGPFWTWPPRA